jgi:ribonuclease BN (tRNA processing enzyme)
MTEIAITCLGSGSALAEGRLWSSLLLDEKILLSLPPTAIPQLYRLGKDPQAIDHIFISHLHADHFFGLPFFLLLYRYRYTRDTPLYIIGPPGMEEATEQLCSAAWPNLEREELSRRALISFVEIEAEGEFQAGDIGFSTVRMNHFGMDAYGYRFTYNGRKIAFTGDTGACPQLDRLCDGADIAITEFTHAVPSDDPNHLDVETVARLTALLRACGATVLATHMRETPDPIEGLLICRDGGTYLV